MDWPRISSDEANGTAQETECTQFILYPRFAKSWSSRCERSGKSVQSSSTKVRARGHQSGDGSKASGCVTTAWTVARCLQN